MILRAPNTDLLVSGKPKTFISAGVASASGTLTVESIASFAVGNMLFIGQIGEERTEVGRVHTSTAPSGSTVTLNANTGFRHENGTPVYYSDYDQVEFSRATTATGAKSVLATSSITPAQMETIYDDTTNTTGFGFFRFKNSAGSTFSSYSDAIPYAGYEVDAAKIIFDRALSVAGAKVNPLLRYEDLLLFLNDFIAFANSKNIRWSEMKVLNSELDTIATGDWEFALPSNIAKASDPSAIIQLHVRGYAPMTYLPQDRWNIVASDLIFTTVATAFTTASTEIVLTNSYQFADSGSIEVEGDSIQYTGNTRSTGTLTGVTGVTANHAASTYALQGNSDAEPIWYSIPSSGYIRVFPICGANVNNRVIYIDYYKKIPTIDTIGDRLGLSDVQPAIDYVAYRIKKHMGGGSLSVNDEDFKLFAAQMQNLVDRDSSGQPIRVRTH